LLFFFVEGFVGFLGAGFFAGFDFFVSAFLAGAFFVTDVWEEPVVLDAETELVAADLL
jgi:hypothetical protein